MGAIMVYGVSHCGKLQVSAQISFSLIWLRTDFLRGLWVPLHS